MAFFCLLHAISLPAYLFFTRIPDGVSKSHPFVDLLAILQGGACWRAGVNVYAPSACLHHGVFNYSPFFLRLAYLPVGPRDAFAGGMLLSLAFIASLRALPRPQSQGELFILLAGILSPSVYYGIEQGNFDIGIFAMLMLGLTLLQAGRIFGYAIFGFAAALKFYPLALGVLILRESLRRFTGLAVLAVLLLAVYLISFGHDTSAAIHILPSGTPFRATFGRIDLARGLSELNLPWGERWLATPLSWAMGLAALAGSGWLAPRRAKALASLQPDRALHLIAGAAIILFCFYGAQNVYYRAIFLIPTLPGLARLAKTSLGPRFLLGAILLLLWEAPIRAALPPGPRLAFWFCREALWWWVTIEFGAYVLAFVTQRLTQLRCIWQLKIDGAT